MTTLSSIHFCNDLYKQLAFYGVSRKFSSQGDMGGPKNEKNARKNGFSTITFICYSNYLKNQNRSLKYIVLKSSMDTFCNIRFKFREYKQKRV